MGKSEKKSGSKKVKSRYDLELLSENQERAEEAARDLYKAMDGLGTDEKTIIQIVCDNSNQQLQAIKNHYLILYKQYLTASLEQNISGKFRDIILDLLKERRIFQAEIMNRAISDIGQGEELMIEILCTKNAAELKTMKQGYLKRFNRDLVADIKNVKDGDHNDLFLKLASGDRNANHGYDIEESRKLAQQLVDATPEGNYIDENVFIEVLTTTSFAQLTSVFAIFSDIYGKDIVAVVEPRSKGSMKQLLLTMIKCCRNRSRYFAERLHYILSGAGTRDEHLRDIIVSRYEVDIPEIKDQYLKLYNAYLWKDIAKDTSGDYERTLLRLIGKD